MGKTFAKEVLEIHENWEGKEFVSMRIKELILVIQIEVTKLYDPGSWDLKYGMPKTPQLKDTKLS